MLADEIVAADQLPEEKGVCLPNPFGACWRPRDPGTAKSGGDDVICRGAPAAPSDDCGIVNQPEVRQVGQARPTAFHHAPGACVHVDAVEGTAGEAQVVPSDAHCRDAVERANQHNLIG